MNFVALKFSKKAMDNPIWHNETNAFEKTNNDTYY